MKPMGLLNGKTIRAGALSTTLIRRIKMVNCDACGLPARKFYFVQHLQKSRTYFGYPMPIERMICMRCAGSEGQAAVVFNRLDEKIRQEVRDLSSVPLSTS